MFQVIQISAIIGLKSKRSEMFLGFLECEEERGGGGFVRKLRKIKI